MLVDCQNRCNTLVVILAKSDEFRQRQLFLVAAAHIAQTCSLQFFYAFLLKDVVRLSEDRVPAVRASWGKCFLPLIRGSVLFLFSNLFLFSAAVPTPGNYIPQVRTCVINLKCVQRPGPKQITIGMFSTPSTRDWQL